MEAAGKMCQMLIDLSFSLTILLNTNSKLHREIRFLFIDVKSVLFRIK